MSLGLLSHRSCLCPPTLPYKKGTFLSIFIMNAFEFIEDVVDDLIVSV